MPARVCDPLGQCITVTVVTTFNTLISIGAKGVSIALSTSVQSYQLVSRLPSGASKVTIYMKSDMPRYPLDVPATTTDDGCIRPGKTASTMTAPPPPPRTIGRMAGAPAAAGVAENRIPAPGTGCGGTTCPGPGR